MKKLLSLLATAFLSVAMFAGQASIVFSELGFENAEDLSIIDGGDVTLTFDQAEGSNAPKYYDLGTDARLYKGNTFTVEATSAITSLVLHISSEGMKKYKEVTVEEGEVSLDAEASTLSWTGNAEEVVFTVADGQLRVVSIDIEAEGELELTIEHKGGDVEIVPADQWSFNFAQALYASTYQMWEIDITHDIDEDENSDLWLSFIVDATSETAFAGVYDVEDMLYSSISFIDGTDTTEIDFVSGVVTINRVANDADGNVVYHIDVDVQDADGNDYKCDFYVPFYFIGDYDTDELIEVTDEITGIELVSAQDFVSIVDNQLVVNANGTVQVYNVLGELLYNGQSGTIANISRGQVLIIRAGNNAAKVLF